MTSSSVSSSYQEVQDIPTLHDLYRDGQIVAEDFSAAEAGQSQRKPNVELNKRVSIWRGKSCPPDRFAHVLLLSCQAA